MKWASECTSSTKSQELLGSSLKHLLRCSMISDRDARRGWHKFSLFAWERDVRGVKIKLSATGSLTKRGENRGQLQVERGSQCAKRSGKVNISSGSSIVVYVLFGLVTGESFFLPPPVSFTRFPGIFSRPFPVSSSPWIFNRKAWSLFTFSFVHLLWAVRLFINTLIFTLFFIFQWRKFSCSFVSSFL